MVSAKKKNTGPSMGASNRGELTWLGLLLEEQGFVPHIRHSNSGDLQQRDELPKPMGTQSAVEN